MPGARATSWSAVGSPGLVRWGLRSWLLVGVLALASAVLWLLSQVSGLVVPLVIAAVMGALFAPLVDRLQARGVPRSAGALLVLLGLIAIVGGSIWLVVSGVLAQAPQIASEVTKGLDTLSSWLASHGVDVGSGAAATDELGSVTGTALGGIASALSGSLASVVALGIGAAIGAFLVYYVIVDWDGLAGFVGSHVGLDPGTGTEIVEDAALSVRRYFWALTLSAVVTAVLIGGTAWALGVPLAFTIAVVTLVTSYVPYLGAIVSGAFATLIALGSNGIDTALIMLVVILVVQNIVQTIVLVKLAGTALSLHPIVVLGATIVGAAVAGILGAALSSPAVAVAIMVRRRLSSRTTPPAEADPEVEVVPPPVAQT
ncbi:MAG TPA: AI-2E family transporter [Ornithinibacter sp.]|nr:AI-2E family transporter [Ornithinibacter sp.]